MSSTNSGRIDCTLVTPTAGRYVVNVRVVTDGDAKLTIIHGSVRRIVSLPETKSESWSNGSWISLELDLVEGSNSIVFTANEIEGSGIDVDRLEATFKQADQSTEGTGKGSSD